MRASLPARLDALERVSSARQAFCFKAAGETAAQAIARTWPSGPPRAAIVLLSWIEPEGAHDA